MTTFSKDFGPYRFSHTVCNKYWITALWEWTLEEMRYTLEEYALRIRGEIQSGLACRA